MTPQQPPDGCFTQIAKIVVGSVMVFVIISGILVYGVLYMASEIKQQPQEHYSDPVFAKPQPIERLPVKQRHLAVEPSYDENCSECPGEGCTYNQSADCYDRRPIHGILFDRDGDPADEEAYLRDQ